MNRRDDFEVEEMTPYGPIYRKKVDGVIEDTRKMLPIEGTYIGNGSAYEFKSPEPTELSESQRWDLRAALAEFGVKLKDSLKTEPRERVSRVRSRHRQLARKGEIDPDRRRFMKVGLAAVAAGTTGAMGMNALRTESGEQEENIGGEKEEIESDNSLQFYEGMEHSNSFEKELVGYKALLELQKDQVLFVDEDNVPIGKPVRFQDFVGPKYDKNTGELLAEKYLFSLGPLNEIGIPANGIPPEWIAYAGAQVQSQSDGRKIHRCLHVTGDFAAAYKNQEEPELQAAIARNEITDYKGIIEYFAKKKVRGAEESNRLQFVRNEMQFDGPLPAVVESELRRLMPGLCSQESKFNNGLSSPAEAKGIFQFIPATWESYKKKVEEEKRIDPKECEKDIKSFQLQTTIAGMFFSDLYKQVRANIGAEGMRFLERFFGDEEALQKDLIVPLMINSYNAGAARVAEAVRLYVENTPVNDMPKGKDLFIAIADFARAAKIANRGRYLTAYGDDAREYVPRVYAQAEVLRA